MLDPSFRSSRSDLALTKKKKKNPASLDIIPLVFPEFLAELIKLLDPSGRSFAGIGECISLRLSFI